MFTGIVTDIGTVKSVENRKLGKRIIIETSFSEKEMELGASICCDGACLTVTDKGKGWFSVDVSQESLDKTTIDYWKKGTKINLEKALKIGDEIGGHMLTGHIDSIAVVHARKKVGDSVKFSIKAPKNLMKFIAKKGSVSINGVSLTVNDVKGEVFELNLIPHSLKNTTFLALEKGDRVNLEIDMIARYVAKIVGKK